MSDIPDSWVWINSYSGAATPLLTLPATPGVSHVIDEIVLAGYANETQAYGVIVQIREDGVVAINQAIAGIANGINAYAALSDTWTGPYAGASGSALDLYISSSAPAGANQVFKFRGHAV